MTKNQLMDLWNITEWDVNISGVYATAQYNSKPLYLNFSGYSENAVFSLSDSFWQTLHSNLDSLDKQAQDIILNYFSETETENDLPSLTDICFDACGCCNAFALSYYTEESPAGELYLSVCFDDAFQADSELIFDVY